MYAGLNTYDAVDWGQPINWSHPLNRGLAAWFLAVPGRFRTRSLQWQDLTRVHVGTLTSTPTWIPQRPGGQMSINFAGGSNQYVTTPHASRLNLSETASTVAFWLYAPHSQPNDFSAFLDKGLGNTLDLHAWIVRPSLSSDNGQIVVAIEDGAVTFAAGSYPNNQWCHIAVTWDGSNVRLYRNGAFLESIAQPSGTYRTSNTEAFIIGALRIAGPGQIGATCRLDDIRLYDSRVLSAGEIAELHRQSSRGNLETLSRIRLPRNSEQAAATTRSYILSGMGSYIIGA